jgi:hypothetical protein
MPKITRRVRPPHNDRYDDIKNDRYRRDGEESTSEFTVRVRRTEQVQIRVTDARCHEAIVIAWADCDSDLSPKAAGCNPPLVSSEWRFMSDYCD